MAEIQEVTQTSFGSEVLGAKVPVLVDFWATWCAPCLALLPKLEEIAGELSGKVKIVKLNIEDCPDIAEDYAVRGVPALLIFKDGELQNSLFGNQSKPAILKSLAPFV